MSCPLAAELAVDGFDVTVCCRLLGVPRSSYYAWQQRAAEPTESDLDYAYLANLAFDIHVASQGTYGAPRVPAELTMGLGLAINRKKSAGLLRVVARQGICATRKSRRSRPAAAVHDDLVKRKLLLTGRIGCGAPT